LQVKGNVKGIWKVEDSILVKGAIVLGTPIGNICVGVFNQTKEVTFIVQETCLKASEFLFTL
jgi:hypothetical protein